MTLKERILHYFKDQKWHSGLQTLKHLNFAWSWDQRKNELQREEGIIFEKRLISGSNNWEYRLVTHPKDIDFENCCLVKRQMQLTLK